MLSVLLCIGLVAIAAVELGGSYTNVGERDFRGAALVFALVPTFLSLTTGLTFALTSWALPGTYPYMLVPSIVAISVLAHVSRKRLTETREIIHSPSLSPRKGLFPARLWPMGALAFLPIIAAIGLQVSQVQTDHDITVYLTEAAHLSNVMRDGLPEPFSWVTFHHPDITHPHTLSFSLYLAWGFLGSASPGYGADFLPRLLVGFNHLSAIAAAFAVGATVQRGRLAPMAGLAAAALVLIEPNWEYQVRAFSRDTFYIAPFLVVIALLLASEPRRTSIADNLVLTLGLLAVALAGALTGHSLGIVYVAGAALAIGLVKLAQYRGAAFLISELWVTSVGLALAGAHSLSKYLGTSAGALGFAYPHYKDPALIAALAEHRRFLSDPSPGEFLWTLASQHAASAIVLVVTLVSLVMALRWRLRGLTPVGFQFIALLGTLAATLMLILIMPLKLDGVSLASAFISNRRYGFGLGVFALLVAMVALVVIYQQTKAADIDSIKPVTMRARVDTVATAAVSAALLFAALVGSSFLIFAKPGREAQIAGLESSVCESLRSHGVRLIYVDNDALLYRCPARAAYLFTVRGAAVIGARGSAQIGQVLDSQEVDAFILTRRIDQWWYRTHLYGYLAKHWSNENSEQRIIVFTRPTFASTIPR